MPISRREFIKLTSATLACACLGTLGTSGCRAKRTSETHSAPPGSFRTAGNSVHVTLAALQEVGGAAKLTISDQEGMEHKIISLHADAHTYLTFAERCMDRGKELNYLPVERKLACAGLGSQFNLSGQAIRGPAEEAVYQYRLGYEGDGLKIQI